jgi:hypothetical protein
MYQRKSKPKRKSNHTPGRTGYWEPKFTKQAYKLALLGATDKQMADFFGVATSVFEYWKQQKDELTASIKRGRLEADAKVAHALYKRALGYKHADVHIMSNRVQEFDQVTGKVTKEYTKPLIVPITKYYPPDTVACIKWLSLRQKEQWAEISKLQVTYEGDISIHHIADQISDQSKFTTDEIKLALKLGVMEAMKNNVVTSN